MSRFILVPQHSCVCLRCGRKSQCCCVDSWPVNTVSGGGQTPSWLCHHLHCNSAMFLSVKLEAASWLRKVFSYEAHSGEVSETSSQCSKLNPVPFGKSAKTVVLLRNYVVGKQLCQTTCQTLSDGHVKRHAGEKFFIVILSACILVDLLPHFERLHGQYHLFSG